MYNDGFWDNDFMYPSLFILDMNCPKSKEFLIKANSKYLYRNPHEWLLLFENKLNVTNRMELFKKLNAFIDSKVVMADVICARKYKLQYVYKLRTNSTVILSHLATWQYEKGFTTFDNTLLSWRRHKLKGAILKTARVLFSNSSFEHLYDNRYKGIDSLTKINILINDALADYLNATNKITYVSSFYTSNNAKHTNTTLLGLIQSNSIDITGSGILCSRNRSDYIVCVASLAQVASFFIFRQPPLSYVKNIYILPFDLNLWLSTVAFIFISSILLYVIVRWEWILIKNNEEIEQPDMIHNTFSDALLFSIGGVCQQGYATEPKGGPGKLLIMTVFLNLIFVFTAYTAYTVVLFQATSDDIKTLEDLYNSKMELGIDSLPYFKLLFEQQTESIRRKIYQDRILHVSNGPHIYETNVGLHKARNEYFAFFVGPYSGYQAIPGIFLDNEICGLREINYFDPEAIWILAPKNSSFLEHFKIGYSKMDEAGLLYRERKRRTATKPTCNNQGQSFRSAGILDLYAVYILLIIGLVSSLVLMIFENIVSSYLLYTKY